MTTADYVEKIPNNVSLRDDRRLQRALEVWQPNFLNWWDAMGPTLPTRDVYLRTAISVDRDGWAQFDHVPMRDYRWGIFSPSARRTDASPSASTRATLPGSKCPVSTAPACSA